MMILITGGAGYIGSIVNLVLHEAGFDTLILDNLSTSKSDLVKWGSLVVGDLHDELLLNQIFRDYPIEAVIHLAALTSVAESVQNPALYYAENVSASLSLFNCMIKAGVKNLIFSSSAAVYGIPDSSSVTEKSPLMPINPYGQSKLIVEKILDDYRNPYEFNSCSLRYFNAAGADHTGQLKFKKNQENLLIPLILESILHKKKLIINGVDYPTKDGTAVRDYIHVTDLATAHLLALKKLLSGNAAACYNLGSGKGFTVREVIRAAEEVTGRSVIAEDGARRVGDPPVLLANTDKANAELNWYPHFKLHQMIEDAWKARN